MMEALSPPKQLLKSSLSLTSLVGILLDPLVIVAGLLVSVWWLDDQFDPPYVILGLIVFSLSFPGTPHFNAPRARTVVRETVLHWLILSAILLLFGWASGYLREFPEGVLHTWFIVTAFALPVAHLGARWGLPRMLVQQGLRRRAIIVGMNEIGLQLAERVRANPYLGVQLVGFIDDRARARIGHATERLIGRLEDLAEIAKNEHIDLIYISLPMASQPRILRILDDLRDTTVSTYFVPDIFLTDLIQGRMDEIGGIPVVAVCETPFVGASGLIKRGSDIVLSLVILTLISPLLAVIALGVKLGSPGPIIFKQRRYGLDGKEIIVYKFRSMTVMEDGGDIRQARRDDHRITPFGAFLRRTSLDELPQFINVLQGRMSIVGPRPHAVAHNELYRKLIKGYMVRHKVKPGITGWAQVNGYRGETETVDKMEKRIEFDLEYLRKWSLAFDLWIIAKTVWVVFRDRNAY